MNKLEQVIEAAIQEAPDILDAAGQLNFSSFRYLADDVVNRMGDPENYDYNHIYRALFAKLPLALAGTTPASPDYERLHDIAAKIFELGLQAGRSRQFVIPENTPVVIDNVMSQVMPANGVSWAVK